MLGLPISAATGAAAALVDLFVVLVAAKVGDEFFKRLHQPALVGEILAGLLVGPAVLGLVEPSVFAELGVVLVPPLLRVVARADAAAVADATAP